MLTTYDILRLSQGLMWTVAIASVAFAGGAVGGLALALLRTSSVPWLRSSAAAFIEVFQGTPLLMQLFLTYFGLPILGIEVSAWTAITAGFTLHASAFLGDIWRGSIEAVPRGQSEASFALSLSYWTAMRHVILPQAMRISLPSTVGFLVQLIKSTSLASIVGVADLLRTGQLIVNATYQPFLIYGLVGALYFALCWPLSIYAEKLENRMGRKSQ